MLAPLNTFASFFEDTTRNGNTLKPRAAFPDWVVSSFLLQRVWGAASPTHTAERALFCTTQHTHALRWLLCALRMPTSVAAPPDSFRCVLAKGTSDSANWRKLLSRTGLWSVRDFNFPPVYECHALQWYPLERQVSDALTSIFQRCSPGKHFPLIV